MKKVVVAGVAALLLAGCGSAADGQTAPADEVKINSAESVKMVEINGAQCVVFDGYKSGGISCNWEAYNATK